MGSFITRNTFSEICSGIKQIKKAASKAAKKCDYSNYIRISCIKPLKSSQLLVKNVLVGRYKQIVFGCSQFAVGCNQAPDKSIML